MHSEKCRPRLCKLTHAHSCESIRPDAQKWRASGPGQAHICLQTTELLLVDCTCLQTTELLLVDCTWIMWKSIPFGFIAPWTRVVVISGRHILIHLLSQSQCNMCEHVTQQQDLPLFPRCYRSGALRTVKKLNFFFWPSNSSELPSGRNLDLPSIVD